ncbi:uncharacterized protein LOC127102782 [Lathyrus oleraceus]|uniref:uncharacterized protein LOC127102782 n=1 Tax=Pisum sativum TaxID=3888 RepID=UPI0021D0D1C5|nr:uncharacterized protein LOC127102782 [Pisum sativum]
MKNYNGATPVVVSTTAQDFKAILMCRALAEKLRILEGHNSTRLSALEMCIAPDVVIPPKLKAPKLEKDKGLTCPNVHLKTYCRKLAAYPRDDKLMIHCFQDSLSGASLDWYMQLQCNNIHTWDELAEAFAKKYKYNTDIPPNRTQLQSMDEKDSESFKEYAQHLRELDARAHPRQVDRELIDIFMGTMQGQHCEILISSVSTRFFDMVIMGERVEEGLKSGKIQGDSNSQPILKKPFNRFKRKEGETSFISSQRGRAPPRAPAPILYYQYPYVTAAQYLKIPYCPVAHVPIPASVPQYQVLVPQYQAPQSQFQAPPP